MSKFKVNCPKIKLNWGNVLCIMMIIEAVLGDNSGLLLKGETR